MKKVFLFALVGFMVSCNADKAETKTDTVKSDSTKEKLEYPYTVDHPGEYWVPGDPNNAVMALKSLKAFYSNKVYTA